ncbi:NDR1/HIN1-like protein 6 [Impatiens glandulifera]|uniref:NDR1/HIN1-like protein 6 n=1 Tax=Impatiens glandulifera TaxID=253017 RepID=UPI001FB08B0E|nr:NDR1/HIN1-like protein 6 [Impatiens glandulifera]
MTDNQKIHPVVHDPEAPPNIPLVPRGSSRSDQPDGGAVIIPKYAPLPPPRKRRSCCCKCLCWTFFLIFLILIILGILTAVFFLVFQPKIPNYSVDRMRITQFNLTNDMNLDASFNVNITAHNPNKKIGIYYENGSHISVWYIGTQLCNGSLPKFYQGHRNTTVLNLILTGQTQNATDLLQSLQTQQQTGSIPLNLIADVPVRLKVGSLKLMKWEFKARCALDVDSLRADNTISIRSSKCKYRFTL